MFIQMTRREGGIQVEPPPMVPDMSGGKIALGARPITAIDYTRAAIWAQEYTKPLGDIQDITLDSLEILPDKIDYLQTAYALDTDTALALTIWHEGDTYQGVAKRITNWGELQKSYEHITSRLLLNGVVYYIQQTDPVRAKLLYR